MISCNLSKVSCCNSYCYVFDDVMGAIALHCIALHCIALPSQLVKNPIPL